MIEVANARRFPAGRMRSDIDAAGPASVGDFPDLGVGRGLIVPQHVVGPVIVEVANPADRIAERMVADIHAAGPLAVRGLPHLRVTIARIEPQHIIGAVAVEVARPRDGIARRMRADIDRADPVHRRCVDHNARIESSVEKGEPLDVAHRVDAIWRTWPQINNLKITISQLIDAELCPRAGIGCRIDSAAAAVDYVVARAAVDGIVLAGSGEILACGGAVDGDRLVRAVPAGECDSGEIDVTVRVDDESLNAISRGAQYPVMAPAPIWLPLRMAVMLARLLR